MWSAEWDGATVVGGDGNLRLTPSFRLKEFRDANGGVRVHRELVSAVQLLRDRFGRPLSVKRTDPDGLGVVVSSERPADQFQLVGIAVEERGRRASPQWQADAVSRRLGILEGVPHTVDDRQRANIHFYMLRDVRVTNVDRLVTGNMSQELARVRVAVASGDTLLA